MNEEAVNPNIRTLLTQSTPATKGEGKIPRRKPVYPMSAERELMRVTLGVAAIINKRIRPTIDRAMAIYDAWAEENIRTDAVTESLEDILAECEESLNGDINVGTIIKSVGRVGKVAQKLSVKDWGLLVDDALDGDISEPFYMETMNDLMDKWVADSVSYISNMSTDALSKIHEIIIWGYNTHQPRINVYRRLQKVTGMTRSRAKLIATDQMGTLNCRMTEYEHKSLGVDKYKWSARHDTRVRPCHREYNNKIFSWNNPPADWYVTKGRGIVYTGNYFHPGEAINCRCSAKPVFEDNAEEMLIQQRARSS